MQKPDTGLMNVCEVQEVLKVKRSRAYRIMKELNGELARKGFYVIPGRVSRSYLQERMNLI